MKYFKVGFLAILFVAYTFGLNSNISIAGQNLPPLGSFLNPYSGFWHNADGADANKKEELSSEGIANPVDVFYDERMVPHIFAGSFRDGLYTQGRILAQNRLWQMDFISRAAEGRLSEVLGARTLRYDLAQRRLGMKYAAEKSAEGWLEVADEGNLKDLEAFVAGVNDHIAGLPYKDYPIEFKLLNYKPEEWSLYKCALFSKYMAQLLCERNEDLEATAALKHFGVEEYEYLYPGWNPKQSPVIPNKYGKAIDEPTHLQLAEEIEAIGLIPKSNKILSDEVVGSNNWAISPSKSASGHAMLANDPHLPLNLPSIWYEMHISCPETNVYGVSLPGIPGIIIGFNDEMAWGTTNVGIDVLDWYTIDWTDDTKTKYTVDGKTHEVEYLVEDFKILNEETVTDSIKLTIWGPIARAAEKPGEPDLACRWVAHDKPGTMDNIFVDIDRSKNYAEYDQVVSRYLSPAQNLVSATRDGHIAMNVQGKLPQKQKNQGKYIQNGNSLSNAWQGYIPEESLPRSVDPERGFVSSANQHSTAPDYPYTYNGHFAHYRGRLINETFENAPNISIEDMKRMQLSTESILPREFLQLALPLVTAAGSDADTQRWLQKLSSWNHRFDASLQEPILFDLWYKAFYDSLWDEMSTANEPDQHLIRPENWRTIEILAEEENKYFDVVSTKEIESRTDILQSSLAKAISKMDSLLEQDKDYAWYQHKGQTIRHMARIPSFSHENVKSGGYKYAPNANSKYNGPSWRMAVEFSDPIKAYGIYPGGQSGNPGSKFYDNMISDWSEGKYYKLNSSSNKSSFAKGALFTQTYTNL